MLCLPVIQSLPQGILPKHVLMIVIDDLGFSDVSYKKSMYNLTGPLFPTPTIDSLALAGVRLESMYVHALCSPSRGAFLSGRYAYTLGMNAEVITDGVPDQLPTNIRTTADLLRGKGWKSAAFGKYDIGMTSWGCTPLCRGFDHHSGFYNADEDYYTHSNGPTLDLRYDFAPDEEQTGVYSTSIFANNAAAWITKMRADGVVNTFSYLAFQAIHGPQEAPSDLVLTGPCADIFPHNNPVRRVACGQMRAADEGIATVIAAYKAAGFWDDTLVIFTADNGANVDTGGNNAPMRGNKASMFEGGMRAASFVSGAGLAAVAGTISHEFYSLTDWLPMIAFGIAGVDPSEALIPKYPYQSSPPPLDGLNIWESISTGSPSPRTEALLYLDPYSCFTGQTPVQCNIPGQGAIRMGKYKLIHGHVSQYMGKNNVSGQFCGYHDGGVPPTQPPMNVTQTTSPPFCPTGWVGVPDGSDTFITLPPEAEGICTAPPCLLPTNSRLLQGGTWLFDVVADPTETTDLSTTFPEIVTQLLTRLQEWNATDVPQAHSPYDPASQNPLFNHTATPWRGDPIPSHCDPNTTVPGGANVKSNFDGVIFGPQTDDAMYQGWAWSIDAPGNGLAPLIATFLLDGTQIGTIVANISRGPQFMNKTGAPNDLHGFAWTVPTALVKSLRTGDHTARVLITAPDGTQIDAMRSPECIVDAIQSPCRRVD